MRAYNPLSVDELGRNAARAIRNWPAVALPPGEQIEGAGVYALYYSGPFPLYADMDEEEPIYVGKAVFTKDKPRPLRHRLGEHAQSVESAENLTLADFRCRWVVLETVWIGMTEQVLIDTHQPLWNLPIARGFGNHHQGTTRYTQRRSRWDTLHPGRAWAANQKDNQADAATIAREIAAHRGRNGP